MEHIIGGYNGEFYKVETDYEFAEDIIKGIESGLDLCATTKKTVLTYFNFNDLMLNMFNYILSQISDEELLQCAKSGFKNSENFTLDMLNKDMIVRNYATTHTIKNINEKQKKLDEFIKTL